MTTASEGVSCDASDATQRYEQLRARMLEAPHTSVAVFSAVVLVRQGMSVWMQLDATPSIEPRTGNDIAPYRIEPPAPKHSELLAVLTSLVFNLTDRKGSA